MFNKSEEKHTSKGLFDLHIKEVDDCDIEKVDGLNEMSKKRIIRNLFILTTGYFLFYSGFWCLTSLQSTMNGAEGLGVVSQAVIYGISLPSSLFLPDFMIRRFGCKNVLTTSTLLGCTYLAANIHLRWDTMLLTSVLYGLMNGPFQAAQNVYCEEIATRYERMVNQTLEVVMACFFGLFTFFAEMTQIWGHILSYYALQPTTSNQTFSNLTQDFDCGFYFRPSENVTNSNLDPPAENNRWVLVGIYLCLGLLSALLYGLFLDPLRNDIKEGGGRRLICQRFFSALRHLKNPYQLLLVPLSIYIGMQGIFYSNEITQAYIACSWGIHHVGLVTICFGVCGALMSLLIGPLVKCVSIMAVLMLATCLHLTMCLLLFLWQPSPDATSVYFIIAGIWGMGDAIFWSQVSALYGLMFPKDREAAFSNLCFWSFLGFFLSNLYADYFTVAVKFNILLVFLITGMLGYLTAHFKIKCLFKKEIPRNRKSSITLGDFKIARHTQLETQVLNVT